LAEKYIGTGKCASARLGEVRVMYEI